MSQSSVFLLNIVVSHSGHDLIPGVYQKRGFELEEGMKINVITGYSSTVCWSSAHNGKGRAGWYRSFIIQFEQPRKLEKKVFF